MAFAKIAIRFKEINCHASNVFRESTNSQKRRHKWDTNERCFFLFYVTKINIFLANSVYAYFYFIGNIASKRLLDVFFPFTIFLKWRFLVYPKCGLQLWLNVCFTCFKLSATQSNDLLHSFLLANKNAV